MTFQTSERPHTSMWGVIDQASQIIPGIWVVHTPSHGGLMLSHERQAAMPETLRLADSQYEEDCNWSLVYVAFEDEFAALPDPQEQERIRLAHHVASQWQSARYATFRAGPAT